MSELGNDLRAGAAILSEPDNGLTPRSEGFVRTLETTSGPIIRGPGKGHHFPEDLQRPLQRPVKAFGRQRPLPFGRTLGLRALITAGNKWWRSKLRGDVVLQLADPNQRYVYINGDVAGQKLQAVWLPFNPEDSSTRKLLLMLLGAYTASGTYDQRVLAFDKTMMEKYLTSPVILVDRNHVPKDATILALRGRDGRPGFVSGVATNTVPGDGDKNRYYPFICFYPAPKYSFAILDPEFGN
ncbi:hypothetical protein GGX14DRAFT_618003 [Mycena pura]|uniref:Uncharacterized protein n=1 Tax=Mycena pura TaxID=153505 RepID=A0AAD6YJ26_9AGAR|nr:hypothetical protein GGX14DRAFT_618003 [Mycena pura]